MTGTFQQPFAATLIAGDSWAWRVSLADYPSDTYQLKFFFRGIGGQLDVVAEPDGSAAGDYLATVSSVNSAALQAGTYGWQMCMFLIADGSRTEIARGTVEVVGDIQSQGVGYDGRSWVKQVLDAVRNVIAGRASRVEQEYTIAGRQLRLTSIDDLLKLEGKFAARYSLEQGDSGQTSGESGKVLAVFGSANEPSGGWR